VTARLLVELVVNGESYGAAIAPQRTLLEVLREDLDLTGEPGRARAVQKRRRASPVVASSVCKNREITTVEGWSKEGCILQSAFVELSAAQCGYCTPGMLLSAKALLDANPAPSRDETKQALSGNLCRCTGYAKILEAVSLAAEGMGARL
jgi:carbon-monoxide dehydrogenase small subunit